MAQQCEPQDPVILIDVDPRETCSFVVHCRIVVMETTYMTYNGEMMRNIYTNTNGATV